MGCSGFGVDPEIAKLLASLDDKVKEYDKLFNKEVEEIKNDQTKILDERKKALTDLKEKNKEITEETLKELNKKELEEIEIKILSNAVGKMHYIFSVGKELAEPLRKITLDQLMEKAKSAPAITINKINSQIKEVKDIPIIDFINSTYGKVLKDAMEKKGMSIVFFNGTKKDIFKERQKRRKAEREEFNLKANEFDDENLDNIKLDLFELIEDEYKEIDTRFEDYARDKMIENMFKK